MANDMRQWFYKYEVWYDIGYKNGSGFGSGQLETKFYSLIGEARDKLHDLYKNPAPDIIMLNCQAPIYFCGWYASVEFTEWGSNREYNNYPHNTEVVDMLVKYVVEGMGGEIRKRCLYETPLALVEVSDRLELPQHKEIQSDKPETIDENSPF